MRPLLLALLALATLGGSALAQDAPEVPCGELHFRIAGEDLLSTCRAVERQSVDGRWREEVIVARAITGLFVVVRDTPITTRVRMARFSPREIAQKLDFQDIEDWSAEMRVGNYRAHSFTGSWGGEESRLRCLSFAQNSPATSGTRARVLGIYCTALANPLDEAVADELLQRIQAQ